MSRRYRIDERTASMTGEVLVCRAQGHLWQRVPISFQRRKDNFANGVVEWLWHCLSCTSERSLVFSLEDGTPVGGMKIAYNRNYLLDKEHHGSGRVPRPASRIAAAVRENADLI